MQKRSSVLAVVSVFLSVHLTVAEAATGTWGVEQTSAMDLATKMANTLPDVKTSIKILCAADKGMCQSKIEKMMTKGKVSLNSKLPSVTAKEGILKIDGISEEVQYQLVGKNNISLTIGSMHFQFNESASMDKNFADLVQFFETAAKKSGKNAWVNPFGIPTAQAGEVRTAGQHFGAAGKNALMAGASLGTVVVGFGIALGPDGEAHSVKAKVGTGIMYAGLASTVYFLGRTVYHLGKGATEATKLAATGKNEATENVNFYCKNDRVHIRTRGNDYMMDDALFQKIEQERGLDTIMTLGQFNNMKAQLNKVCDKEDGGNPYLAMISRSLFGSYKTYNIPKEEVEGLNEEAQ